MHTCTLWAPACTVQLFKDMYVPAITGRSISDFSLFVLTDKAENDDNCAKVYNKSLLYLVSNAFEDKQRIPLFRDGVPILGMEKFLKKDADMLALFKSGKVELVLSPNAEGDHSTNHCTARSHGSFDDDKATVTATLNRILNTSKAIPGLMFSSSATSMQKTRENLSGIKSK